jgi:NAD(P)-dependent dehydrogenase (short-subunit alcohol dehydrogenase family)
LKNVFDMSGKTAIITGGAGLLGISHARALLQMNCNVELWDNDLAGLETSVSLLQEEFPHSNCSGKVVDVTIEEDIKSAVERLRQENIEIQVLINNAAINPKVSSSHANSLTRFEDFDVERWNREVSVGLTGSILCCKHLGNWMAEKRNGVILNISSDLSVIAPNQRIYANDNQPEAEQSKKPVSYSVIKTGLIGLTRYLATYWAESGIRVNALSPGGVFDGQDSTFVNNLVNLIPMGRMASPGEYIGAIQFLCSDASSYMTGQNIVIDGGRSVW